MHLPTHHVDRRIPELSDYVVKVIEIDMID